MTVSHIRIEALAQEALPVHHQGMAVLPVDRQRQPTAVMWAAVALALLLAAAALGVALGKGGSSPPVASTTPVSVPQVVGMPKAAAVARLQATGLRLGQVFLQYSSTTPAGIVIVMTPQPGATLIKGSSVSLAVSLGPLPRH